MNENGDSTAAAHHGLRCGERMDTPGRFSSPSKPCGGINETELGELKISPSETSPTTVVHGVPCRDGACRRTNFAGGKNQPQHRIENPWHYLKTVFLVTIIVALLVWILVYVLLSQYDLL